MGSDHAKFAAFILTHGRPDRVKTWHGLQKWGYTGDIYLIVDNEDETADEYRRIYGENRVIEFDKAATAKTVDEADTTGDRRAVMYARNASFQIARDLGLDYILQLDDDYTSIRYRYVRAGDPKDSTPIRSMDAVIEASLTFLDDSGAAVFAWSQGGDWVGGRTNRTQRKGIRRKAMNAMFLRVDQPVEFLGRINDDVNAYVVHGSRGALFLTAYAVMVTQTPTQTNAGGMTEVYREGGTYAKSFYSVMMAPSCVTARILHGVGAGRIHHQVKFDHAVPMILSDRHRRHQGAAT